MFVFSEWVFNSIYLFLTCDKLINLSKGKGRDSGLKWNRSAWVPKIVIVNLPLSHSAYFNTPSAPLGEWVLFLICHCALPLLSYGSILSFAWLSCLFAIRNKLIFDIYVLNSYSSILIHLEILYNSITLLLGTRSSELTPWASKGVVIPPRAQFST